MGVIIFVIAWMEKIPDGR